MGDSDVGADNSGDGDRCRQVGAVCFHGVCRAYALCRRRQPHENGRLEQLGARS